MRPRTIGSLLLGLCCALALSLGDAAAAGSSAEAGAASPTLLFAQDATGGSLAPIARHPGQYRVTLRGVEPRTLWFENRPGVFKGTLSNARMLDLFYGRAARGEPAPNGAIDAWDPRRGHDVVMGVKLLHGSWDARTRTLRYRVARLHQRPPRPSAKLHAKPTRIDSVLPRRFGEAGVFVDDEICYGACHAIMGIVELGNIANDFFTARNTCSAGIFNDTGASLTWVGDDSKSEDSWQVNPPRTLPLIRPQFAVMPSFSGWMTVSAWARGCWNNVTYRNAYGTVAIGVSDPYSSGNDWWCHATGRLRCIGPEHRVRDWQWPRVQQYVLSYMGEASVLGGSHIRAAYCVARTDVPLREYPCDDDPLRE